MTLECQRCGKPTPVPDIPKQGTNEPERERKLTDLKQQLRENESQRTEITTYINQLSIQLHRWQLRLQTLNERKAQLEKISWVESASIMRFVPNRLQIEVHERTPVAFARSAQTPATRMSRAI